MIICFAFSALTLLAGRQKENPAYKNCVMGCWHGRQSGAKCRLFAFGPANATASQTLSLASFKSRLALPFQYRLTQAVLEERPLSGCSSSSSRMMMCINMFLILKQNKMQTKH